MSGNGYGRYSMQMGMERVQRQVNRRNSVLVGNRIIRVLFELAVKWQILRYLAFQLTPDRLPHQQRVLHLLLARHLVPLYVLVSKFWRWDWN